MFFTDKENRRYIHTFLLAIVLIFFALDLVIPNNTTVTTWESKNKNDSAVTGSWELFYDYPVMRMYENEKAASVETKDLLTQVGYSFAPRDIQKKNFDDMFVTNLNQAPDDIADCTNATCKYTTKKDGEGDPANWENSCNSNFDMVGWVYYSFGALMWFGAFIVSQTHFSVRWKFGTLLMIFLLALLAFQIMRLVFDSTLHDKDKCFIRAIDTNWMQPSIKDSAPAQKMEITKEGKATDSFHYWSTLINTIFTFLTVVYTTWWIADGYDEAVTKQSMGGGGTTMAW